MQYKAKSKTIKFNINDTSDTTTILEHLLQPRQVIKRVLARPHYSTANIVELKPNKRDKRGRDYVEVLFVSDPHIGSQECEMRLLMTQLDYCLKNKIYILCVGDFLEFATRHSIGAGVYEQIMSPQEQMEVVKHLLKPLAKAGLLIGFHSGNHEDRAVKEVGLFPSLMIANALNVPYLGAGGWTYIRLGKIRYSIYSVHGKTGSVHCHTKLKAAKDIASRFPDSDIFAMAHTHTLNAGAALREYVDSRGRLQYRKQHILLTGHYMRYGGYGRAAGYEPLEMGSPKVKLYADKFDIHSSI